jgi:hypothetical protein
MTVFTYNDVSSVRALRERISMYEKKPRATGDLFNVDMDIFDSEMTTILTDRIKRDYMQKGYSINLGIVSNRIHSIVSGPDVASSTRHSPAQRVHNFFSYFEGILIHSLQCSRLGTAARFVETHPEIVQVVLDNVIEPALTVEKIDQILHTILFSIGEFNVFPIPNIPVKIEYRRAIHTFLVNHLQEFPKLHTLRITVSDNYENLLALLKVIPRTNITTLGVSLTSIDISALEPIDERWKLLEDLQPRVQHLNLWHRGADMWLESSHLYRLVYGYPDWRFHNTFPGFGGWSGFSWDLYRNDERYEHICLLMTLLSGRHISRVGYRSGLRLLDVGMFRSHLLPMLRRG